MNMKIFICLAILPALACGAILPDAIGTHTRQTAAAQPAVSAADQPIWAELGLKAFEQAEYTAHLAVSAYQLPDSTAALAGFYWLRPAASKPSTASPMAAETPDSLLLVVGNYIVQFRGYRPSKTEIAAFAGGLTKVDHTPLPALYLPGSNLVANSERYITGPVALKQFVPGISPEISGFEYGAEAESGVFHSSQGDVTLAVFNYPTPQIAMKQMAAFEQAGLLAKRSGPLVSVIPGAPSDRGFAQNLLDGVAYRAQVTIPEHIFTLKDNIGNLVINAFILIGILLAITLGAGLFVGGFRIYQRRGGRDPDANTVISLHLE